MAPFYPVYVRRSDGTVTATKSSNAKEDNAPLPEQLDTNPNAQGVCDYYRECQPGEGKEVDWRRKLGGMLIRELQPGQSSNNNFILAALPEGYRLFEHVRFKVSDSNEPAQKPAKNHAAGSNERQDAYLYGHPQGRKKRYRSPAEYFPHLLWLATDEQGDSNNCTCKFCSPEEIETEEKQMIPAKDIKQTTPKPKPEQNSTAAPPRFRSKEQSVDAKYNNFLFRPGELIWFQRDNQSWGLGAIVDRQPRGSSYALYTRMYRIQPLSHPFSHRPSVFCAQNYLRPWLAWSPPPCYNQDLNPAPTNNMNPPSYHTVDWQAYLKEGMGQAKAEIDGSILIAKFVETTFTLFDPIESKTSTKENGYTSEIYYNGFFFGSEKIWLGDPLRLRNSANITDLMILKSIIERSTATNSSQSGIILEGDIYSQSISDDPSEAAKHNANLPLRVQEEVKVRNSIAQQAEDPSKRVQLYYKLDVQNVQRTLSDIKGRWYESSILVPIIAPADYEAARRRGELSDATLWMNGQGDCNKSPTAVLGSYRAADTKIRRREEAFGRAVPPNFQISKGLDDPAMASADGKPANEPTVAEKSAHAPPSNSQQLQQKQPMQNPTSQALDRAAPAQQQPPQPSHGQNAYQGQGHSNNEEVAQPANDTQANPQQQQQSQNQPMEFESEAANSSVDQYMDFSYADGQT